MKNRDTWKFIIQTIAAILTAIATSLGVTSCMSALWTADIVEGEVPRVVLPPLLPQNVSDKREQRAFDCGQNAVACSAERRKRRTSERRAELARTFLSEEEEDEVKRRRNQPTKTTKPCKHSVLTRGTSTIRGKTPPPLSHTPTVGTLYSSPNHNFSYC